MWDVLRSQNRKYRSVHAPVSVKGEDGRMIVKREREIDREIWSPTDQDPGLPKHQQGINSHSRRSVFRSSGCCTHRI